MREMLRPVVGLMTAVAAQAVLSSQTPPRQPTSDMPAMIPSVASLSELRPRTSDERAAAEMFNVGDGGLGPLIPGTVRQVIEEHGPSSAAVWEVLFPPPDTSGLSLADAQAARDRYAREKEERRTDWEESEFRDRVCRSAAVVVGRPIAHNILLTTRDDFLFTHYVATVERWIRPYSEQRSAVDIAVAGGTVLVGDRSVSASVMDLKMPVLTERAVFYLAAIKDSTWYASGTPEPLNEPGQSELIDRLSAAAATCR